MTIDFNIDNSLTGGPARLSRRAWLRSATGLVGASMLPGAATGLFGAALLPQPASAAPDDAPPDIPREFRGVWVATVSNADWPSHRGLSADEQRAELLAILDRAAALRLNAVIFHVRPSADALYRSPLEPWSEFISGAMGGDPGYDPLEFAVTEAHRRGLELHAWFNPFRVRLLGNTSPAAANHLSRAHPEWVRRYGPFLWLDPGVKPARDFVVSVITDVARRYDIDGVHVDDYFYPYAELDAAKRKIPFPDNASWAAYRGGGGALSRDDWRRSNINDFVQAMYTGVRAAKPTVKIGISPFGIWRPGFPPQIKGLDAYSELYANSRTWLQNGWLDYLAPQLYWKIETPAQSFPVLLGWWQQQNALARHIWPGLYTARMLEKWPVHEIAYQVKATRGMNANGAIHFSMKSLMAAPQGPADVLASMVYTEPALVPATPWLGNGDAPASPAAVLSADRTAVSWMPAGPGVRFWAVQTRGAAGWRTAILPAETQNIPLAAAATHVAVTAVDLVGRTSAPTIVAVAA